MEASSSTEFDPRSGHGDASTVPEEIKQLNWGAFLMGFIWGIGNRVWLAFLVFVPIVNVVAPFVLLVKGNEWAWRAKAWPSVEVFQRTQRKWAMAGLIVLGISVAIPIIAFVLLLAFGKSVDPQITNSNQPVVQEPLDSDFGMELEEGGEAPSSVTGEWISYEPAAKDFVVELPDYPVVENGSYPEGDLTITTRVLRTSQSGETYLVAVEEYPEPFAVGTEDEELRNSLSIVEEALEGAKIRTMESTTIQGFPAIRYLIDLQALEEGEADRIEEGVLIMKGESVYTVASEYENGKKPEQFDRFQASFKFN